MNILNSITPIQWLGIGLITAYVIFVWRNEISSGFKKLGLSVGAKTNTIIAEANSLLQDDLTERMARLADLQKDLEDRGCTSEAKTAGAWYALLRKPLIPPSEEIKNV